jgi:sugar/nucleoside kinase (ribokinase family)
MYLVRGEALFDLFLDTESLEDLVTYTLAAASLTCSRRGADLPSRDDVQSVVKSYE